ncbi:hypothetical protein ACKRZS_003870 [Fusarium odoratissimum]
MKPEPKDPKEVTKMAHDFAPNSDSPPLVSSVTADDPSKDTSKNSRSLLDPSGPATVDLMMGVQLMPPEAQSRDDRIKPFDVVKSQLEDVIKPINFPDTTKFQNDTWPPALPVKPTPDNPAKPWGTVRDLWLKPKDGEGSAKKAVELWITAMSWTVGDLTGVVPERAAKDLASLYDENEEDDDDSALGEDFASSTASLTSSILEYRKLQGRTFNSDKYETEYFAPNDEKQKESIDISHHYLMLLLDGKLSLVPSTDDLEKVLDIGTGTGIWAIDFADQYPNAEVIGTDLSPIQPDWVRPDVRFELEDATSNWTWSNDRFDFVHMRYLIGAIADWGALFKEAFRCCKPGGFVESVEVNPTFLSDDETASDVMAVQTWNKLFREASNTFGRSFCEIEGDVEFLAAAGYVDLQVTDFKVPVGGWAKDSKLRQVGQFLRATIENDLEGKQVIVSGLQSSKRIQDTPSWRGSRSWGGPKMNMSYF